MEQKKSEFNKVLNAWDVLVIAFGAMIGWGWVVSTGGWIEKGGVLATALRHGCCQLRVGHSHEKYHDTADYEADCGTEHSALFNPASG